MNAAEQKVVQYLNEAFATEEALVRVLQSQIAMTPRGTYRSGLEKHLEETRDHARRVGDRLGELGHGSNPVQAALGIAETVVGQILALTKTPFDMVRGSGGEEKILKNAKDACATEALEIATYTTIQALATAVGDTKTANLAKSILKDEQKMLDRVTGELPKLVEAVVRAEVKGDPSFDITTTGAADSARKTARKATKSAKRASDSTKKTARKARKVPGVAQAEGQIKGAVASASDLAIARYDSLNADEIVAKLSDLSQIDLAKVDSYERKNQNRSTVLSRVESLRGDEPWAGYDELSVSEIKAVISEGDEDRARKIQTYERAHKARTGVLETAERETSNA